MDATEAHVFQPETKDTPMQFKHPEYSAPMKAKLIPRQNDGLCFVSADNRKKGHSITEAFYANLLIALQETIKSRFSMKDIYI